MAKGLPPTVTFLAPADGRTVQQPFVPVRLRLTDQGGGIGKLIWKRNGRSATAQVLRRPWPQQDTSPSHRQSLLTSAEAMSERYDAALNPTSIERTYHLTLVPGVNRLEVFAYNQSNHIRSRIAMRRLTYSPATQPSSALSLYILAVGINRYLHEGLRLKYAVSDVKALITAIQEVAGPKFRNVVVKQVLDEAATRTQMAAVFHQITAQIQPQDMFVFILAGHGIALQGHYYFLPQDMPSASPKAIRDIAVSQDDFQRWLSPLSTRKTLAILDTCDSGTFSLHQTPLS
ncbi:hypothetical protein C2W62_43525, partial [Candidatus Entotheonella serta]